MHHATFADCHDIQEQMILEADYREQMNDFDLPETECGVDLSYAGRTPNDIAKLASKKGQTIGRYLDDIATLRDSILADRFKDNCSDIGECD